MDIRSVLSTLTGCHGISGRETGAAQAAIALLSPYGAVHQSPLGNVVLEREGNSPQKQEHITLTAHLDEIGMMIREIDGNGFLKFAKVGGLDPRGLMGQEVLVLGEEPLYGIICSVPPHLTSAGDRKKLLDLDDLSIDVGLSREEAQKRISIGDTAVLLSPLTDLENGLVAGKALDNRAGCASLLWALDRLKGVDLGCNVTVVFAALEEINSAGAKTAHFDGSITHAIAVDVTFAQSHGDKPKPCRLGSGPAVGISPLLDREMARELMETAKRCQIPFTTEVMGGRTGTDADSIHLSGQGVITGLLSIPQRNMHTPVEIVDPQDVTATGDLIAAYLEGHWGCGERKVD